MTMQGQTFTPRVAARVWFPHRRELGGLGERQPEAPVWFTSHSERGLRFMVSVLAVRGSADPGWRIDTEFELCQWGVTGPGAPVTSWEWAGLEAAQKPFMLPEGDFGIPEEFLENIALNPSLEVDAVGWQQFNGTGGAATGSRQTDGGYAGDAYRRMTWTQATTSPTGGEAGAQTPVTPGQEVTIGLAARPSKAARGRYGARLSNGAYVWAESSILPGGVWSYGGLSLEVPAGVTSIAPTWQASGTDGVDGASNWAVGDTLDVDAASVIPGRHMPRYVDGTLTIPAKPGTTVSSDDQLPVHRSRLVRGFGDMVAIHNRYKNVVNPTPDFATLLSITTT